MGRSPQTTGVLDALSSLGLFVQLPSTSLSALSCAARLCHWGPQQRLYSAGDCVSDAHFLLRGAIKRATQLSGDLEKVLEIVRPGQAFGLSEVFSATRYASYAESIEPSVVIAIAASVLRDVVREDGTLGLRLVETLAQGQRAAEFEVLNHHSVSSSQRVLEYLVRLAGEERSIAGETTVRLDASKKLVAARLDMAPETFSRTLRQLSEVGVIVVDKRDIHIQNATLTVDGGNPDLALPPLSRLPSREQLEVALDPIAVINLCGRQRMLTQRMAVAWIMMGRRISPDAAGVALRRHLHHFERTLIHLASLKKPGKLRQPLQELNAVWPAYRAALTEHEPQRANGDLVFDLSEQALEAADRLTTAAVLRVGSDAARLVNTAGRNRMLPARLTKLVLFHDWGLRLEPASLLMQASRNEFTTHMAELGSDGTAGPEVAAQLAVDVNQWKRFIAAIDADHIQTSRLGHLRVIVSAHEELLRHLDTTVKLCERRAQQAINNDTPEG